MKNYKILTVNEKYIIVATSHINPIDELYKIEDDLKQKEFVGEVMFDLLFCNGIANRYIEVHFNGSSFDIIKNRSLADVDADIKEAIYSFYMDNKNILKDSNLSAAEQFLLKKKLIK